MNDNTQANLARIALMRSWTDNWDGEGGIAPQPEALDTAERLLILLDPHGLCFGIDLDADSRPMCNLRRPVWDGFIVIEGDGCLSFSFEHPNLGLRDGFNLVFGQVLPDNLTDALSWIRLSSC